MASPSVNDGWDGILESLTRLCVDNKVPEEFRKTLRSELIDKALIPIVKKVPAAVGVYAPNADTQALTVHFGWSATPTAQSGVRLTVYRHVLLHRETVFMTCTFVGDTSMKYKVYDTETEAAQDLKSRLDQLRRENDTIR